MSKFMTNGVDLNAALQNEGPTTLTDDQVVTGLDDGGQTGTRTMKVQFGADGEILEASNTGLNTAQANPGYSNAEDMQVAGLQKQYDQIAEKLQAGLADGSIKDGDDQHKKLLADAANMQAIATEYGEQAANSTNVRDAQTDAQQERTIANLEEALEDQQELAALRDVNAKRKRMGLSPMKG